MQNAKKIMRKAKKLCHAFHFPRLEASISSPHGEQKKPRKRAGVFT